ncbi:MAG: virulence protein [Bacteroidia bacterium]|nr:virulence protein [Bacteroidia bacterium]
MNIKFNVPGQKRKELAKDIGTWLGSEVKYCGAPSFAYEVDYFTIDRNGCLSFDDRSDSEVIERLLEHLYDEGFECEEAPTVEEKREESKPDGIAIQIPLSKVQVGNLTLILDAKGNLIKKALGIDDLRFSLMEDRVDFPWFPADCKPEELQAYMHFITALCEMSKNQKRITAKEKTVDNEKYAFRCFLLRLGFIGDEYKAERKILLRNLSGSSSFKSSQRKEDENDA